MDFNTGSGGSEGSGGSSQRPGGTPPRVSGGASGNEFDYTDPIQSFINTVRNVVTGPVDFFRGIRRQGDFLNPVLFAIICYEISAILSGILGLAGVGTSRGIGSFLVALILAPIFAAIGLFIGAGIVHLLVILIVGSRNAGYEGTLRVSAYSSVTSLVSWIPIIGLIASLYGVYLAIVGIREVHSTTTGRAALVVLIPVIVVILLVVLILGAALVAIFAASQQ